MLHRSLVDSNVNGSLFTAFNHTIPLTLHVPFIRSALVKRTICFLHNMTPNITYDFHLSHSVTMTLKVIARILYSYSQIMQIHTSNLLLIFDSVYHSIEEKGGEGLLFVSRMHRNKYGNDV